MTKIKQISEYYPNSSDSSGGPQQQKQNTNILYKK